MVTSCVSKLCVCVDKLCGDKLCVMTKLCVVKLCVSKVCVDKFCVVTSSVWTSCVWSSCVWASCVWTSCVWESFVWTSCVWASCVVTSCVVTSCVVKLCVEQALCGDGRRGGGGEAGVHNQKLQKQEPHTKMWGIIEDYGCFGRVPGFYLSCRGPQGFGGSLASTKLFWYLVDLYMMISQIVRKKRASKLYGRPTQFSPKKHNPSHPHGHLPGDARSAGGSKERFKKTPVVAH